MLRGMLPPLRQRRWWPSLLLAATVLAALLLGALLGSAVAGAAVALALGLLAQRLVDRRPGARPSAFPASLPTPATASSAATATAAPRHLDVAGHGAHTDDLTGLANRRALHGRLETALAEPGARAALVLLDVDAFKDVNDTLGHHAGDRVLRLVAQRLEHVAIEADLLARVGGDEFAVLLTGDGVDDAGAIGRRIRTLLEAPLEVEGLAIRLGANIGIALAPAPRHRRDRPARRADVAMHLAKRSAPASRSTRPSATATPPRASRSPPSCTARSTPASSRSTSSRRPTRAPAR